MSLNLHLSSLNYTFLSIFYTTGDKGGSIVLSKQGENGRIQENVSSTKGWYLTLSLEPSSEYYLSCIDVIVDLAYLHGSKEDLDKGIAIIDTESGAVVSEEDYGALYDSPYCNQFHFTAPKNWMNDPNGLCLWNGYYHVFYQSNPHSLKWGDMHWGHAVSKDLVSWTHLPIVLFPQDSLKDVFDKKGGAYSGCALPENDGIHLYFTRCFSPLVRDITSVEHQMEAVCNGEYTGEEKTTITSMPLATSKDFNFRDPKVVYIDGLPTMLIATTVDGVCSVVAYRKNEVGEWSFAGMMFQDPVIDCNSFECANFFEDTEKGLCALICSIQDKPTVGWQRRASRVYICSRKGLSLHSIKNREIDFGHGSYALQLMSGTDHENIAFSWCLDTFGLIDASHARTNGCFSIPLSLSISDGELIIRPYRSIYSLLTNKIVVHPDEEGFLSYAIESLSYHVCIDLSGDTPFSVKLVQSINGEQYLTLDYKDGMLSFYNFPGNSRSNSLLQRTEIRDLKKLEVFVDRSVVEVFANAGLGYGCTSFFIPDRRPVVEAFFDNQSAVGKMEISMLKSIWKYKKEKNL